jgi:outer membrane protein TolC
MSSTFALLAVLLAQPPKGSDAPLSGPLTSSPSNSEQELRGDTMPTNDPLKLGLEECIQRAFARNPNAIVAAAEVRRSSALIEEVRAASFPTVYGNATWTHINAPVSFTQSGSSTPIVVTNQDQLVANLPITFPVLAPPHWAQWAHAGDQKSVAWMSATDVRRQLAVAVAHAYVAVIAQRHLLASNISARDSAKAHLDYTDTRVQRGASSRLDQARAQQQYFTNQSLVEGSQIGLTKAQEALGVLVAGDVPVDVSEDPNFGGQMGFDEAQAQDELPKLRADILTLDRKLVLANHVARDDYTDYLPSLSIVFTPSYNAPPSLFSPRWFWQAQMVLSIPIYEGGLRYGQAKERAELEVEAQTNLEGAIRQAHSELRADLEAVHRSALGLSQAQEASVAAHKALDMATLSYRAGASSNLDVVDAETRARDADIEVARAKEILSGAQIDALSASGRWP